MELSYTMLQSKSSEFRWKSKLLKVTALLEPSQVKEPSLWMSDAPIQIPVRDLPLPIGDSLNIKRHLMIYERGDWFNCPNGQLIDTEPF